MSLLAPGSYVTYVTCMGGPMAVNHKSGRLVVDIDPELKMALHAALAAEGMTLKEWFVTRASEFVSQHRQPPLFLNPTPPAFGSDR